MPFAGPSKPVPCRPRRVCGSGGKDRWLWNGLPASPVQILDSSRHGCRSELGAVLPGDRSKRSQLPPELGLNLCRAKTNELSGIVGTRGTNPVRVVVILSLSRVNLRFRSCRSAQKLQGRKHRQLLKSRDVLPQDVLCHRRIAYIEPQPA